GNGIYFTNDEVIEFLDSAGFEWPEFPRREPLGSESEEHKAILDRGHEYQNKTFYISRILSALYSFRPNGQALVERVQEVGLVVVGAQALRPEDVVRSNAYFGRKLREAGISAEEFKQLLDQARDNDIGIIPLAERLGCSLYETQALLHDIKKAESDEKRLIDFKAIVAPRWGAARSKTTLEQWRSYAGAYRRATIQQAKERAAKRYGNENSLRTEILRRLERPRSEYLKSIIDRALSQGESLYRIIGKQVRDYSQSTGEQAYTFDLPRLGMKGKISRDLPEDAEVVYFRDAIQERIQSRPAIAERYSELIEGKQYNDAQDMLVNHRLCSRFEAGFYTNPKVRIVAVHSSQSSPEIIVLRDLPGLQPTLDDWFSWDECCKSKGWEVELGEVFNRSDEELSRAIDAFMQEHNQRKQDDWNSYGYMLNDYIGVEREGRGNCLRAVMLGYLKTNEIVIGNNCYSCSRCVPDENFSRDLDLRKSVVQLLRQEIIEIISEIEQQYVQNLPPKEIFQRLWELASQEEKQARRVHPYLQGWSGRVLTDTPEHKAVHLLRLEAMYHGHWEFRPEEFLRHLQRLLATCTQDELLQIEYLFRHIRQHEPENPKALELMAEFYRKQGLLIEELNELKLLVQKKPTYELYERIIFISEQLRVSASELEAYYIQCARLAPSDERALELYDKTNVFVDNDSVVAESTLLLDSRPSQTTKVMRLIARYLDKKPDWIVEELIPVGDFWAQTRQNYRIAEENIDRELCMRITELFSSHIARVPEQERYHMLNLARNFGTHVILLKESLISTEIGVQEFGFIEAVLSGSDELIISAIDYADFRFAREALLYLAQKQHTLALEKALKHPAPALRRLACWLILRSSPAKVPEVLAKLVNDADAKVRRFACRLAVHYKEKAALQMFLKDPNKQIRRIAAKALGVNEERGLRTKFSGLFSVFSKLKKRSK
ncbi:MAG: HEAT repeat domain-containing protein, partial [Candidatus Methanomethylicaceae archaeon]